MATYTSLACLHFLALIEDFVIAYFIFVVGFDDEPDAVTTFLQHRGRGGVGQLQFGIGVVVAVLNENNHLARAAWTLPLKEVEGIPALFFYAQCFQLFVVLRDAFVIGSIVPFLSFVTNLDLYELFFDLTNDVADATVFLLELVVFVNDTLVALHSRHRHVV